MTTDDNVIRPCPCADPWNCTETVPGYRCRKGEVLQPRSEGTTPAPATPRDEGDDLHTGDDDLLDALTGIRAGLDAALEGDHGTMSAELHEALGDIYEDLTRADELRVAELKAARSPGAVPEAHPHETHRCSGCGHSWHDLPGAELCGDCWRAVQPQLHATAPAAVPQPAPAPPPAAPDPARS